MDPVPVGHSVVDGDPEFVSRTIVYDVRADQAPTTVRSLNGSKEWGA